MPPLASRTLETHIQQAPAFVSFDWIVPSSDIVVARVLSLLLNSAQYGLLYKPLELKKKWISELEVGIDNRRGPNVFSIQSYLNDEKYRGPFEEATLETLRDISLGQFSQHYVYKSTKKLKLMWLQALEGSTSKHEQLTSWLLYHRDPDQLKPHIKAHSCIQLYDIQRFAKKLLSLPYLSSHNYAS